MKGDSPSQLSITPSLVDALERCLAAAGVVVFPTDTVYGLGCDPLSQPAVRRLYQLKRRPLTQPSAVLFFTVELALAALPELDARTVQAVQRLLPGPVTVLLANPQRRFPLACGADSAVLGLRVPALADHLKPLQQLQRPLLQSSANLAGEGELAQLAGLHPELRHAVDLIVEGGQLPGRSSTIVDLTHYATAARWRIVREGAYTQQLVAAALGGAA